MFSGCGGGEDERAPVYPVTGTVTRNGTALEGAVVTFVPAEGGKGAAGTTDASGKYTLTTWAQGDGAQAGSYRVTIAKYSSPAGQAAAPAPANPPPADTNSLVLQEEYPSDYNEMEAAEQPPSQNMLPPQFADPSQSGFKADVTEDESKNVFDFNIPG